MLLLITILITSNDRSCCQICLSGFFSNFLSSLPVRLSPGADVLKPLSIVRFPTVPGSHLVVFLIYPPAMLSRSIAYHGPPSVVICSHHPFHLFSSTFNTFKTPTILLPSSSALHTLKKNSCALASQWEVPTSSGSGLASN